MYNQKSEIKKYNFLKFKRCIASFFSMLFCVSVFMNVLSPQTNSVTTVSDSTTQYNHSSCKYTQGKDYCLVCDIAKKINDLPLPDDINIYNAASVVSQIHAIDRIKFDLTDDEYYEMLPLLDGGIDRYFNAVEAVNKISGDIQIAIVKKYSLAGSNSEPLDLSQAVVSIEVEPVGQSDEQGNTIQPFRLDMGGLAVYSRMNLNEIGDMSVYNEEDKQGIYLYSDPAFYSVNTNGNSTTTTYKLPAGQYRIREINTDSPTIINGKSYTTTSTTCTYNGQEISMGDIITLQDGVNSIEFNNLYIPLDSSSFEFVPPASLEYDGNAKTATVIPIGDAIMRVEQIDIKYFKDGSDERIETPPTEPGVYKVKIDAICYDTAQNAYDITSDDWTFTIGPPSINLSGNNVANVTGYQTDWENVYQVNITWGPMVFVYDRGKYDTDTGTLERASDLQGVEAGKDDGYINCWYGFDGTNNAVTVENISTGDLMVTAQAEKNSNDALNSVEMQLYYPSDSLWNVGDEYSDEYSTDDIMSDVRHDTDIAMNTCGVDGNVKGIFSKVTFNENNTVDYEQTAKGTIYLNITGNLGESFSTDSEQKDNIGTITLNFNIL